MKQLGMKQQNFIHLLPHSKNMLKNTIKKVKALMKIMLYREITKISLVTYQTYFQALQNFITKTRMTIR